MGLAVTLDVNERWTEDDKDYTPYTNILSAAWPELRLAIRLCLLILL